MNVENLRIPDLVKKHAQDNGSKIAIEDEGQSISFSELDSLRIKAAKAFLTIGIEAGDRVAVWAPNIHEWIVATIGLQSIGAVLVPVNTRMKGSEAAYVLRTSGARVLCTVSGFLGFDYPSMLEGETLPDLEKIVVMKGQAGNHIDWTSFLESGNSVSDEQLADIEKNLKPSDLADLIFTSGTTGNPKGVMCSHEQNLKVFSVWAEVVGLTENDRYLIVNPFFHTFGYKAGWMAALVQGACILPHAVFDAAEVMERIGRDRVSVLPGPPTLYQSILAHPDFRNYDMSSLRLAVTGAAAIPVSLIHQMRDELKFETVLTAYGLTESCGVATMCRQGDDAEVIANTSGRAIPDVEVLCVDENNNEVPRGEAGEIVVRGYNVMSGYFENEEETRKTIDKDGWLHTGDVGIMDEQGNIRITDRIKDMFIVGGFNVYPAEIENTLVSHEAISQAAVIGMPDERMGEVAMACVVKNAGAELNEENLINWCKEKMANYKVPRKVVFIDELPLNATGKVQKFVLREKFGSSS